jgi:L-ascorbate metabolism protein UlaG (beta-lactamase superfamily)
MIMKIRWMGHACFLITDKGGKRILTDPFDQSVGYPVPEVEADIVTVSHGHFDHNYTKAVKGDFEVVDAVGSFTVKGIPIKGVATFHDEEKGAKRGKNNVYVMEIDRLKVCHLGDLGHVLDDGTVKDIGPVDVLLIPVGGYYTIDAQTAVKVVGQLKPRLVIPMHFKTAVMDFPIVGVDDFLNEIGKGERVGSNEIEITAGDLGDTMQVKVLDFE